MPDSLVVPAALRSALERIVDYAGLFPPARLSMQEAAVEYERDRGGSHGWTLGRFVVPASRVEALELALGGNDAVALAVILDTQAPLRATSRTRPETCEVALRLDNEAGAARTAVRGLRKACDALAPATPIAVELPRHLASTVLAEAMDALGEEGFSAKLRCGGVTAEATPSVAEIAAFVTAATRAHVAFKATAGLHHPIRHFNDASGFPMHGFLNVLAAACFAPDSDAATIASIVGEEDAAAFVLDERGLAWRDWVANEQTLREVRATRFLSFGSCSFAEPVGDLIALRVLSAP